jgi:hypothetical protein
MQVKINAQESNLPVALSTKFSDFVELVKSIIDPDHMITDIKIDGGNIFLDNWLLPLQSVSDSNGRALNETTIIEVETDLPVKYVYTQLSKCPRAVQACYLEFRDARKTFQSGDSQLGNKKLLGASQTLKAFFDWYITLLQITPEEFRSLINLETHAEEILSVCKRICELQLYRSWWPLSEIIEKELEPKLDTLEDKCRAMCIELDSIFT